MGRRTIIPTEDQITLLCLLRQPGHFLLADNAARSKMSMPRLIDTEAGQVVQCVNWNDWAFAVNVGWIEDGPGELGIYRLTTYGKVVAKRCD